MGITTHIYDENYQEFLGHIVQDESRIVRCPGETPLADAADFINGKATLTRTLLCRQDLQLGQGQL